MKIIEVLEVYQRFISRLNKYENMSIAGLINSGKGNIGISMLCTLLYKNDRPITRDEFKLLYNCVERLEVSNHLLSEITVLD